MRRALAVIACFAVAFVVSACGAAEEKKEEVKKEEAKPAAGDGGYELVDTQVLKFRLQGQSNYGDARDDDGIKPNGGKVGVFTCEGQKIELANEAFEDGFIVTKNYGKIKIRFTTTMLGIVLNVFCTAEQKGQLAKLRQ